MVFFRVLVAIDTVAALVALWFFFVGLADGSVSDFNIGVWGLLLGCIGAILGGGIWLRARGLPGRANAVLLVLAAPAFGGGLLLLALILNPPN